MDEQQESAGRIRTGIPGLDEIVGGGLPGQHLYLIEGESGTGKTTMSLQFLLEGVRMGEKVLLITMAEAAVDLHEVARSHGWSLEGVQIYELSAAGAAAQLDNQQTIFPTSEVELGEITDELVAVLEQTEPQRVVFDSVTEIRMLAESSMRYRRQMLALSKILNRINTTVVLTDRLGMVYDVRVLDSLVHGIIRLERRAPLYGGAQRRLEVAKLRGVSYADGWYDFSIEKGGIRVYPRPRVQGRREHASWKRLSSGLQSLDSLLGGGLEMGTAALIMGASGTGKSSIASLYVYSALRQGIPVVFLVFDERPETLYKRTADLGIPLRPFVEEGLLVVRQVETAEISPGELIGYISDHVEDQGMRVVVIDSLTGYLRATPEENLMMNQMHDLINYLSWRGVLSLLIVTQHGVVGEATGPGIDISYLADTVVLLRHFEADGLLRQAISVVKKRHGEHERTIREIRIEPGGIRVGPPLTGFRGVLTGNPDYTGQINLLLDQPDNESA